MKDKTAMENGLFVVFGEKIPMEFLMQIRPNIHRVLMLVNLLLSDKICFDFMEKSWK